jgi:hypothetical protein
MIFDVRFIAAADDDLARLFDFMLDQAETLESRLAAGCQH